MAVNPAYMDDLIDKWQRAMGTKTPAFLDMSQRPAPTPEFLKAKPAAAPNPAARVGFTSFEEALNPKELARQMNKGLSPKILAAASKAPKGIAGVGGPLAALVLGGAYAARNFATKDSTGTYRFDTSKEAFKGALDDAVPKSGPVFGVPALMDLISRGVNSQAAQTFFADPLTRASGGAPPRAGAFEVPSVDNLVAQRAAGSPPTPPGGLPFRYPDQRDVPVVLAPGEVPPAEVVQPATAQDLAVVTGQGTVDGLARFQRGTVYQDPNNKLSLSDKPFFAGQKPFVGDFGNAGGGDVVLQGANSVYGQGDFVRADIDGNTAVSFGGRDQSVGGRLRAGELPGRIGFDGKFRPDYDLALSLLRGSSAPNLEPTGDPIQDKLNLIQAQNDAIEADTSLDVYQKNERRNALGLDRDYNLYSDLQKLQAKAGFDLQGDLKKEEFKAMLADPKNRAQAMKNILGGLSELKVDGKYPAGAVRKYINEYAEFFGGKESAKAVAEAFDPIKPVAVKRTEVPNLLKQFGMDMSPEALPELRRKVAEAAGVSEDMVTIEGM